MDSRDINEEKVAEVNRLAEKISGLARMAHELEPKKNDSDSKVARPLYSAEMTLDVFPKTNDGRLREAYANLSNAKSMAKDRGYDELYDELCEAIDTYSKLFPNFTNPSEEKK